MDLAVGETTIYWMLIQSIHMLPSGEPPPEPCIRPVDAMIVGPLLLSSGYEVSSLVRSTTVWNTMLVTRHSVSPQMVVLAEALCAEKATP